MVTKDNAGRTRVGPRDTRRLRDRVLPYRHGKWWNFDTKSGTTKNAEALYAGLSTGGPDEARVTLEHVEAIAQTAVDRAAAADRRATIIAGTVPIAASFTLSGAGLVLDGTKILDESVRTWFAAILCVTTVLFVASAGYALRALIATRVWNWSEPYDLPVDPNEPLPKQLGMRAAHLLEDFAGNWEISDVKNRTVDVALRCLVAALCGIAALAGLLALYVA